ncbi:hypothetical protein PoB_000785400 [Plakobranchus ocellatus]|uniref:4Fe-4S ferredoxin-type domain-containing protein n=1 Tax=Plakobranchus ocellatus TaxID=259542 RepID=A0AAV3YGC3_9GAST|nr:hypothetical protein PoB_000785400 [Plakobranchus ocellatus]
MCKAPPVASETLIQPRIKLRHTHGIPECITVCPIEALEISAQLRHLDKAFGRTMATRFLSNEGDRRATRALTMDC